MPTLELKVRSLAAPKRIDAYLAGVWKPKFSRQEIKTALLKGRVFLNGKPARPRYMVQEGDCIAGDFPDRDVAFLLPESIPLKIIYEDDWILVIDKPAGMVVHPGAGNKKGTLVQALLGKECALSTLGGRHRPGIVHRLDKETSGLLVVAKDNEAHRGLQSQFESRSLSKTYLALVKGRVEFEGGTIDEPLGRHPKIRQKQAVLKNGSGKPAETRYRVIRRFPHATLLEVKILTGRTHQIRVHMAHLGHPVIGDALYGARGGLSRQALHAAELRFTHPKTGKMMAFESPLPDDFKQILKKVEEEER